MNSHLEDKQRSCQQASVKNSKTFLPVCVWYIKYPVHCRNHHIFQPSRNRKIC